jgi:membrane-bound serine protease (ClpP class)
MRRTVRVVCAALAMVGAGAASMRPAAAQTDQPLVDRVELTGVVDPIIADHIATVIERANERRADAVLLTIDTPGGLGSSMDQIDQAILNSAVPVIGYVSPIGARAASAGAFILLSTPVAAMAPGTNVGASTPIGLSGGDLAQKVQNDAEASMRKLAQTYGRNEDVAASFVSSAASITAEEALDEGVIDTIAASEEELLTDLDGQTVALANGQDVTLHTADASVEDQPLGAFMGFLHGLIDPNLAFIFFWVGLGLIVLELIVPGHIFSGTIGTLLLIAALVSFGILPVRVIGIALLVLSVIAFIVELHAPGLGIWGAIGLVALVLGGWFLYDRSAGVHVSPQVLIAVAAFAALFFGFIVAKALQVRHTPSMQLRRIVGAEGVALPMGVGPDGGQVRVASEQWRAVAPAGRIAGGAPVRVLSLDGLVLTVEPATTEHDAPEHPVPSQEGGTTV